MARVVVAVVVVVLVSAADAGDADACSGDSSAHTPPHTPLPPSDAELSQHFLSAPPQPFPADVRAFIEASQFPADCGARRFVVYNYWNWGWCAEAHWVQAALSHALLTGRTLVFNHSSEWVWRAAAADAAADADADADADDADAFCPRSTTPVAHECYFRPLSSCTMAEHVRDDNALVLSHEHWRVDAPHTLRQQIMQRTLYTVPERWRANGTFWWRAALARWLAVLNPRTAAHVDAQVRAHPTLRSLPNANVLAMHLRLGDKQGERDDRYVYSLDEYMPHIEQLRRDRARRQRAVGDGDGDVDGAGDAGSPFDIFLASDDRETLDDARARSGSDALHGHRVHTFDYERREARIWDKAERRWRTSGFSQRHLRDGAYDVTVESLNMLRDLAVLAEADAGFVGDFVSNIARLAYEMQAGRRLLSVSSQPSDALASEEQRRASLPPAWAQYGPRPMFEKKHARLMNNGRYPPNELWWLNP